MQSPPPLLLQKTPQGLLSYGAHSGPMLDALIMGQVMTATPRKGRTLPRNSAYWAGVQNAVQATDAWPTPPHLHDAIKRLCGYVEWHYDPLLDRQIERVQSTKFDKMPESEFAAFFSLAQLKFIGKMGFDPWVRE